MKTFTCTIVGAAMLWAGSALAQSTPSTGQSQPSASPAAPEKISGRVVDIDRAQQTVTLQGEDGKTYKFRTSEETLKDLKTGDQLDATLRAGSATTR
jgi:hypothetical protein